MTCIVGIETPRGVMLGADSMAGEFTYWTAGEHAEPKVFRVGPYVIGFTSSFRMGDLLRYHLALPDPPARASHKHMVTKVVPAVRALFRAHGFATTKEGAEVGGDFLVGVSGALYRVSSDHQVSRSRYGYAAVGSGAQTALGALSAIANPRRARESLRAAPEAAARHSMGVRGPWRFIAERACP
jgi:hypothetical protein